ncbi:hypothetical protein JAAARDRAFT_333000 [Jaapia argillacea MUCL 33604]|uniref:Uncharacterized protein n=1 Tax=Jaapia argillacea MUCL 33604 TaxID=933084 RepID=A0A067PNB9_9AGAM|nr:hypothetical protein JAAARDRAFT_333000 [Jaapia argillacea MUCL 33604]
MAPLMPSVLISTVFIVSVAALPIARSVICSPATWHNIIVFFMINYAAHAATIPAAAGATWYDTMFWTVVCLLLPFAGLGKAMGLVLNYTWVGDSELEKAWARDALLVVARSNAWEPSDEPEEVYVKLPKGFLTVKDDCATMPSATIKITRDGQGHDLQPHKSLKTHGGIELPLDKGYQLSYPDPYYLSEYFPFRSKINRDTTLGKTQSWVKMAISVAQLFYSTITLCRTQGSQLEKYGYAAYGLSVFPYTFMSLANFLCIGLVGEYPSIYILRTAIIREAEGRGGKFTGVVGCCEGEIGSAAVTAADKPVVEWGEFTRTTLSAAVDSWDSKEEDASFLQNSKILVVKVGGVTKKYRFLPQAQTADHVFYVSSYANQNSIPDGGCVFSIPTLRDLVYKVVFALAFALALVLPYLVIYGFSRFEARESTLGQRGWMMAWLSSGQLAFLSFGWISTRMPHFSPSTWRDIYNDPHPGWYLGPLIPSLFLLPVTAIGGFIAAGQMVAEFGTCTLSISP